MNELNIGSITLPVKSATKTFAILAKKGAGKTYTAGVMAEEFFKVGVHFFTTQPHTFMDTKNATPKRSVKTVTSDPTPTPREKKDIKSNIDNR